MFPISCEATAEYIYHGFCSDGIKQNGQDATCTTDGWNDYYKCFGCDKIYSDIDCDNEITDLEAWKLGDGRIAASHNFGDPTYTWSADGSTCTAKRVCSKDNSHVETATATVTSAEKTPASETVMGWTTYTANFAES